MENYPKIIAVEPLENYNLLVTFNDSSIKLYDCSLLFEEALFLLLKDKAIFQSVKLDKGGYGIFWNDDLDLSEAELWINGKAVECMYASEQVLARDWNLPEEDEAWVNL